MAARRPVEQPARRELAKPVRASTGKPSPNRKAPAAPAAPQSPQDRDAAAIAKLLGKDDAEGAAALSRNFFPEGSLGRVNTGFNPNGGRIAENQDVLDRMRAKMEAMGPGGGARRSADVTEFIDRSRAGLEGYTAPENQAMLEQQMRGVNQGYMQGADRLSRDAAKLGIRGGSLAALRGKVEKQAARGESEARQNLFVKNADEKQERLSQFGQAVQGVEQGEYDRDRQSTGDYYDTLSKMRADELDREKTNINQVNAERSGQAATYFGGLERGASNRAQAEERKMNKNYYNLAKSMYGRSGRGGRSSGGTAANPSGYFDEAKKVVEQYA